MPQVTLSTYRTAVLVAAALLAGCGAADTPTVGSLAPALTAERSATSSQRSLYVLYQGVNTLVEYSHDGTQVLRKITHGIHGPKSLAIDSQGAIYIGNSTDPKRGGVNVYLPGKLSPTTNIKTDGRPSLALDADGNVYVAAKRSVGVYGNYGKTLLRTINTTKYLYNIALDSSGNLYVGTGGGINVYQAGQTKLSRTIPLRYAFYLAVDRTDNLYAVAYDSAKEIIDEFAPNSSVPKREITDIGKVNEMALDEHGSLYVGNCGVCFYSDPGNIAVYQRKQTSPSRTIVDGIAQPYAVAYDSPDLYVADFSKANVTIYLHGKTTLTNTIPPVGDGIPIALAFGP